MECRFIPTSGDKGLDTMSLMSSLSTPAVSSQKAAVPGPAENFVGIRTFGLQQVSAS